MVLIGIRIKRHKVKSPITEVATNQGGITGFADFSG